MSNLNQTNLTPEEARQMAEFGRLLASLWLQEVDLERLQQLASPAIEPLMQELNWTVPAATPAAVEALAVEYCRLFVGPKDHVSPFESVWKSNQHQGDAASSMKAWFALLPEHSPPHSMHDHIGVQIDLASELLDAAGRTVESESTDGENMTAAWEPPVGFASQRLPWMDAFLHRVVGRIAAAEEQRIADDSAGASLGSQYAKDALAFYRSLAIATRKWLAELLTLASR